MRLRADSLEVQAGLLRLANKAANPEPLLEEIGREMAKNLEALTPVQELAGGDGGRLRDNMTKYRVVREGNLVVLEIGDEANLGDETPGSGTGLGLIRDFFAANPDLRGWTHTAEEKSAIATVKKKKAKANKISQTLKTRNRRARKQAEHERIKAERQAEREAKRAETTGHPWWKAFKAYEERHQRNANWDDYRALRQEKALRKAQKAAPKTQQVPKPPKSVPSHEHLRQEYLHWQEQARAFNKEARYQTKMNQIVLNTLRKLHGEGGMRRTPEFQRIMIQWTQLVARQEQIRENMNRAHQAFKDAGGHK